MKDVKPASLEAEGESKSPKASVRKNGYLSLIWGAPEVMNLEEGDKLSVAILSNSLEERFALLPTQEGDPDKSIVRVRKWSCYVLNLKNLFVRKGVEYQKYQFRYDIFEEKAEGRTIYILESSGNRKLR